jgi:hypothetical protein
MIHGSFHADSKDLESIDLKTSNNAYANIRPFLDFDCGELDFTVWLDPKDLPRIAGMLHSAAAAIDALIEASNEKPQLRLVPQAA